MDGWMDEIRMYVCIGFFFAVGLSNGDHLPLLLALARRPSFPPAPQRSKGKELVEDFS